MTLAIKGSKRWSIDRKSTRLNSSHLVISYAVFCLKKKTRQTRRAALQREDIGPRRPGCATWRRPFALLFLFFFFNDTATTEIYTLSLHDALPIYTSNLLRAVVHAPERLDV